MGVVYPCPTVSIRFLLIMGIVSNVNSLIRYLTNGRFKAVVCYLIKEPCDEIDLRDCMVTLNK